MQQRQHLPLRLLLEIDQEIAAGGQIDLRERRVLEQVLRREHQPVAQVLPDLVAVTGRDEEAAQTLDRKVLLDRARKHAATADAQIVPGGIGREDLDVEALVRGLGGFRQQDCERIGLLAGRARGRPDADGIADLPLSDQGLDHLGVQLLPGRRIAKEAGDVDHQVVDQRRDLIRTAPQDVFVVGDPLDALQAHAPVDATLHHVALVTVEFVAAPGPQQRQDPVDLDVELPGRLGRLVPVRDIEVPDVTQQRFGHRLGRQHKVDHAGGDRAARHAGVLRGLGQLREHQATAALDRAAPGGAVAAGAGQDDGDRPLALILGERDEEGVDRMPGAAPLAGLGEVQHAASDRQLAVGQDHVHAVGLDPGALLDRDHVHPGVPAEQLDHVALPGRVEVLDDHEGEAAVGRHGGEELLERLDAARRCPDSDDREGGHRGVFGRRRRRSLVALFGQPCAPVDARPRASPRHRSASLSQECPLKSSAAH